MVETHFTTTLKGHIPWFSPDQRPMIHCFQGAPARMVTMRVNVTQRYSLVTLSSTLFQTGHPINHESLSCACCAPTKAVVLIVDPGAESLEP